MAKRESIRVFVCDLHTQMHNGMGYLFSIDSCLKYSGCRLLPPAGKGVSLGYELARQSAAGVCGGIVCRETVNKRPEAEEAGKP